jgi:hypothetical protein
MLSVSSTSFLDRRRSDTKLQSEKREAEQHSFRCPPQIRDRIDEAFYALADRTDSPVKSTHISYPIVRRLLCGRMLSQWSQIFQPVVKTFRHEVPSNLTQITVW